MIAQNIVKQKPENQQMHRLDSVDKMIHTDYIYIYYCLVNKTLGRKDTSHKSLWAPQK